MSSIYSKTKLRNKRRINRSPYAPKISKFITKHNENAATHSNYNNKNKKTENKGTRKEHMKNTRNLHFKTVASFTNPFFPTHESMKLPLFSLLLYSRHFFYKVLRSVLWQKEAKSHLPPKVGKWLGSSILGASGA